MKIQLKVLTGTRAGYVFVFSQDSVQIGRHPSSDLQFDPDHDLEVSARHAALVRQGPRWIVRDLGSLNGTFVNGHRIAADIALDDTDQIRLGADGPAIEFRLVSDGVATGMHAPPGTEEEDRAAFRATPRATAAGTRLRGQTTERIRVEVGRQTRRLRTLSYASVVLLLVVAAAFVVDSVRQRRLRARDVAAIELQADSAIRAAADAVEALQGQVHGLATALRDSREEVESLGTALDNAQQSGREDEVRRLRRQLADASQALLYRQAAAYVDYRDIVGANELAVAMIWAELGDGEVFTGTAFAVSADGILITSRHVMAGASGTARPRRIAVKFANSYQVYPGRLLGVSPDADLAAVKVDVPGGVPTVRGLNRRTDTLRAGDPVAIVGFPHGAELPMSPAESGRTIARASFSAGSVSKALPDVIQVDGYGAEGSSGSPILDQRGEVIGVVYGGQAGSGGRVVLGVPARLIAHLIEAVR